MIEVVIVRWSATGRMVRGVRQGRASRCFARQTVGTGLATGAAIQGLAEDLQKRWNPNCEVEGGRDVLVRVTFRLGVGGQVVGEVASQKDHVRRGVPAGGGQLRRHAAGPPVAEVQVAGVEDAGPPAQVEANLLAADGRRAEGAELERRQLAAARRHGHGTSSRATGE